MRKVSYIGPNGIPYSSGFNTKRMNGDTYVYLTDFDVPPVKVLGDSRNVDHVFATAEHMLRMAPKGGQG